MKCGDLVLRIHNVYSSTLTSARPRNQHDVSTDADTVCTESVYPRNIVVWWGFDQKPASVWASGAGVGSRREIFTIT